jgi:hypothetical protein
MDFALFVSSCYCTVHAVEEQIVDVTIVGD